ncbi:MAG: GNAT family N-acetyltransferase [Pseudomonadota bacterium]
MTELSTSRLLLRPPREEDFSGWIEFCADEHTMEHLGGVQHEADAWRMFTGHVGIWSLGRPCMFSVIEKASGEWIGRIGPWCPHLWPVQEVGWGILRRFEGKGYALEAAVASIDYVFSTLNWPTVSHLIAEENTRSQVLAQRLGATPRGEARMPGFLERWPVTEWRQDKESWCENREQFAELL